MLKALRDNELIEKYAIELLKFSLSGDDQDFWRVYDEMLEMLNYARVNLDGQNFVVKALEDRMYYQYQEFTKQKLQTFDLFHIIDMKRSWQKQRQISDKCQYPKTIYCILTPLKFVLNTEIHKLSDYGIAPYAFVFKEHVAHANKVAQGKGILKGLSGLLVRKIDPDTKVIELNRYGYSKFQQIFEIFKQRYRQLSPFLVGEEIHFVLKHQQSSQDWREVLEVQIQSMIEDIYGISGLRMFGFVSRNEVICDMLVKDTPLKMIESKRNNQIRILLQDREIKQALLQCKVSSVSGMPLNLTRFLHKSSIRTVKQLLQNLHLLQMVTSSQQAHIFMETCLGIDHRQNLDYIEKRRKQFREMGMNYDRIVPPSEESKLQSLRREKSKEQKQKYNEKDFDSDSVRSEKINPIKKVPVFNTKSEKNPSIKNSQKQQYFPMFGKKGKK